MSDYYYYPSDSEKEENEVQILMRDVFWSITRAHLQKKICKGIGGASQWAYITGKRSRDRQGRRIRLTDENIKILEGITEYFNSEEGLEELLKIGITTPPTDMDDLIYIIAQSKTRDQTKKEEFQLFLKNRNNILRFLSKLGYAV